MREVMHREQPMITTGPGFENTVITSFAAFIGNTNYQAWSTGFFVTEFLLTRF